MTGEGRPPCEVLKVASASKPVSVAGAIAGVIRSQQRVEVHAIGAGAVNQAIKAIAISRGDLVVVDVSPGDVFTFHSEPRRKATASDGFRAPHGTLA